MNKSLRLQLLIATSCSSAAVLALLGLGIYGTMRHLLLADYDASLVAKGRALAATTEQRSGRVKIEFEPKQMPEFSAARRPDYFEIWLDDGRVLTRSESLRGGDLPRAPADVHASRGRFVLPGGTHHARAVAFTFTPRQEGEQGRAGRPISRACTIAVAGNPEETEHLLEYLGWLLLASCGLAIVLSGALLLWIATRAVKPVRDVARAIERVRETDLASRLEPAGVPVELAPVVEKLNALLDRLEHAFIREKAFTADVAHELRTPLAGLQATMDVCRSRPRGPGEYEAAIDECRAMAGRMQRMVENLLLLARAEAGQLPLSRRPVNVAMLLADCWAVFERRAAARGASVRWEDVAGPDAADTDPDQLRIVIQNLFDNAVSYVDPGGTIRIAVAMRGRELSVEVANGGSGVGPPDVPHLFERFWRGDASRSETGIHCGLGLSLSRRLVGLLGGEIHVEASVGGEFVVRLSLPAARAETGAEAAESRVALLR